MAAKPRKRHAERSGGGAEGQGPPLTAEATASHLRWPTPMREEALHGLVGEAVRLIVPASESDPAAILVQFLAMFGAHIGRGPHYRIEDDEHHANLFALLVGDSSKGRKGTSLGRVRQLFGPMLPVPEASGLSSGEGLISAVRDPLTKLVRDKQSGENLQEVVDEGANDKRLLVVESEFAQALDAASRHGSILSATIRCAWGGRELRTLTKNAPLKATNAHVTIIGHITSDELRAKLAETDRANTGFYSWACAGRNTSHTAVRFLRIRSQSWRRGSNTPQIPPGPAIACG
jgi:hypothetical protein